MPVGERLFVLSDGSGGAFGVVELWIEGNRMVEVLTEQMQREYLDTMRLDAWQAMLAQGGDGQRVAA